MMNDFYDNLTTITNNLEDITFTKYATITNLNGDGTCTAKEDEEDGLTHENVLTLSHNLLPLLASIFSNLYIKGGRI